MYKIRTESPKGGCSRGQEHYCWRVRTESDSSLVMSANPVLWDPRQTTVPLFLHVYNMINNSRIFYL